MKRNLYLAIVFSAIGLFTGCTTTFTAVYGTRLDPPQKEPLKYEDDRFSFVFEPVNNGIFFKIYNKTGKPAYVEWAKSFFIQPNGNSFMAANTDLLNTTSKLTANQESESTIPSHAYFERFTTSATNIQEFTFAQVNTATTQLTTSKVSTLIASGNASIIDFFRAGTFWPVEATVNNYELTTAKLEQMGSNLIQYIKANDNLGLGFYLMYDNKPVEYQFAFKFAKVSVYVSEINPEAAQKKQVYLAYVAEARDGWAWHEIRRPTALKSEQQQ